MGMSCSGWGRRREKGGNAVMGPFHFWLEALKQLLADILMAKPSQILPGWGGGPRWHHIPKPPRGYVRDRMAFRA